GDIASIFLPARGDAPSPHTGEKEAAGDPRAATARRRPAGGDGRRARTTRG
ncbi:hypothetical protein BHE74_00026440, partial [Ensete ventricosum]